MQLGFQRCLVGRRPAHPVELGLPPHGDGGVEQGDGGFEGEVTLIGAEDHFPYERPHLSKGYLLGTVPVDRLALRPKDQYIELDIDLLRGERVVDLGLQERGAWLESGRKIQWDRLCVAAGSDVRRLEDFGDALYLRELRDAERLKALIDRREPLDIVGAGFIGCEVAAAARQRGCAVRVHEALTQPLLRVLGAELGGYLGEVHRRHGVDMRLNVESPPAAHGIRLVGVGSAPRTGFTISGLRAMLAASWLMSSAAHPRPACSPPAM